MLRRWYQGNLSAKLILGTVAIVLATFALLLPLLIDAYRGQLQQESAAASRAVSRLLQSALENAMLKRDLQGLAEIVTGLGSQDGIHGVMILNPHGEVRFASDRAALGRRYTFADSALCTDCAASVARGDSSIEFMRQGDAPEVLRSINPVANRTACVQCHGQVYDNPVNGIVVVDHDASAIRGQARTSAFALAGAAGLVTLFGLGGAGWLIRRHVLRPIARLADTGSALAAGDLGARVDIRGNDELAGLGRTLNEMASNLQHSIQTVRDKELFLQAVVDAVPDGIRVIDQDYRLMLTNAAYLEQQSVGRHQAEPTTCYASSHARCEPCPAAMVTCPVRSLGLDDPSLRLIERHVSNDGRHHPVEVYAAAMQAPASMGSQRLVVESIRNIERNVNFSHQQKLAEMASIAAGVAHEIRNPLASIRIALQATLRSLRRKEDAAGWHDVSEHLELMDQQVDQCLDINRRLLKLAMPASGHPQLLSLNTLARETISLLQAEALVCEVEIFEDLSPQEPRVLGEDSEIRMVVVNLLQNAFHAMPDGGEVHIRTEPTEGHVVLTVRDTGVGIKPRDQVKVFEPFYSHRADGMEGTGLGLSICAAILKRHHGTIEVDGSVTDGACFKVVLPDAEHALGEEGG